MNTADNGQTFFDPLDEILLNLKLSAETRRPLFLPVYYDAEEFPGRFVETLKIRLRREAVPFRVMDLEKEPPIRFRLFPSRLKQAEEFAGRCCVSGAR